MAYIPQTPLVEQWHPGGFIVSLANGHLSFDSGVFTAGHAYLPGTVLGKDASGKWAVYKPDATDGTQHAAGLSYGFVDARQADQPGTVLARQAEVNGAELVWDAAIDAGKQAAALSELAATAILAR